MEESEASFYLHHREQGATSLKRKHVVSGSGEDDLAVDTIRIGDVVHLVL